MVDISHPIGVHAAKRARGSISAVFGLARPSDRNVDFSNRQIAVMFVALAAIASIPILIHPWPPLADYINHLARMHIIAAIGVDPDLARFYEVDWQIIPNLMMDLVVPLLERVMNVYVAGQLYTIASFVLILSGTLALNRRLFGHWSILPLIAFPLLYNNIFLVGTMNYVFGIGLSLWALVAWLWLRERNMALRLALSTLFVLALFFCHLFAVGLYGLGLLAFELHRLWQVYTRQPHLVLADFNGNRPLSPLVDFVACALPFLPVVPLLMMSPTWTLRGSFLWEFSGKADGLLFVIEVYSHFAAFVVTGVVAFAAGWGVRHRALRFHSAGWVLMGVGTVIYMAMPRVVFETYMADQRLPISLAFMIIACAQINLAVRYVERGSKVLVAYADPDGGDDVKDLGLVHAACLAIIERSALVTTAFTVVGKQILHVRDDYRARVDTTDGTPPTVAQLVQVADQSGAGATSYWGRWTSDYDYVYVLFTDRDYENPDPARLIPIYAGERFVLYKINASPQVADVAEPSASR